MEFLLSTKESIMTDQFADFKEISRQARKELITMIGGLGVGHVGGSLSIIEALVYLYFREMRIRPENPSWADRDRFILSKGHAGPALYTILAMRGYFDKSLLATLNQPDTNLPSHCDMLRTTGVDMTAGSLGQGLSAAVGMAYSARLDAKDYRVFCIVGDGEMQEGQIWEAAMYAASRKLDNLVVLIDDNDLQIDGATDDINSVRSIEERWAAFGWDVMPVNGHDFSHLENAFAFARQGGGKPKAIVMRTIKGRGVSIAEGKLSSHNMPLSPEDTAAALLELG